MPSLRTDKGNRWMARAMVHGKQVACKLFSAGPKHGTSWKQAKAWEDRQKALALQTFEDEQCELALQKFQNEQKAFLLKAWKAGQEAIAEKLQKEEQKALELEELHKKHLQEFSLINETRQANLKQKALEEQQNKLALRLFEEEQEETSADENFLESKGLVTQGVVKIRRKQDIVQPMEQISQGETNNATTSKLPMQTMVKKVMEKIVPTKGNILQKWGEKYLEHAKRTMSHKTFVEKQTVMKSFYAYCEEENITSLAVITPAKAYEFLADANDEKGGNVANKYRKNLLAAWTWGASFIDDFPQGGSPFIKVRPFAKEQQDRYVPPEEDVIKVLQQAKGQDLIFLLTFYYTGARRGEIFKLKWQDVDLREEKIRLTDHKAGNGQKRVRWLQMHPELVRALTWWKKERPCEVENVFMQTHCKSHMGKPFTQRIHFMENLCQKAGVKPFGFHAIRHKCAAITFCEAGLNDAQILMGHYRSTTTDIYTKSAGLYTKQDGILAALGGSRIGKMVGELLDFTEPQTCYS